MLYIVAMTTILGRGFHDWYGSADLDLKRNESVGVVMVWWWEAGERFY